MRPDVTRTLYGIAAELGTNIMAEVRTPHGQQTVQLAAGLLAMVAQEVDRAAARLVEENAAILAIFERARTVLVDHALREQLEAALAIVPGSDLHVAALQAENDSLRALLIQLHATVEGMGGDDAEALDRLIWDELRMSTRRRHLESGLA